MSASKTKIIKPLIKLILGVVFLIHLLLLGQALVFVADFHSNLSQDPNYSYSNPRFKQVYKYHLALAVRNIINTNSQVNQLCDLDIIIKPDTLSSLNSDLPLSGEKYHKIKIETADDIYKAELKFRGQSNWHWTYKNKSMRIRLKDNKEYDGYQDFSLVLPETKNAISELITFDIAREIGLYAQHLKPKAVCINNDYHGLYIFQERIGPEFFAKYNKPYESVFSGNSFFLVDEPYFRNLFKNAFLWELRGNNENEATAYKPLRELNQLISLNLRNKVGNIDKLRSLIDVNYFTLFSAYNTFIQTAHYDNLHNLKFYFDNENQKFYQIVDDPVGWALLNEKNFHFDLVNNDLYQALYQDPRIVAEKNKKLLELNQQFPAARIADKSSEYYQQIKPYSKTYLFRGHKWIKNLPQYIQLFTGAISANESKITAGLNDQNICFQAAENGLRIVNHGQAPKKIKSIQYANNSQPATYFANNRVINLANTIFYPGREVVEYSEPNIFKYKILIPKGLEYKLTSNKRPTDQIESITFINTLTKNEFTKASNPSCAQQELDTEYTIHPWQL